MQLLAILKHGKADKIKALCLKITSLVNVGKKKNTTTVGHLFIFGVHKINKKLILSLIKKRYYTHTK